MFCTRCGTELQAEARFCTKCGTQVVANNEPSDESFLIDFLYSSDEEKTLKGVGIDYQAKTQYLFFDGQKEYPNLYYVEDRGWSSDRKYRKIATPDFVFWVRPDDFSRLWRVLTFKKTSQEKAKRIRLEKAKMDLAIPITYDEITDDIYVSFIAFKSSMCDAIGTWDKFNKLEERIAKLCESKGGRYYKSQSKLAKFAIIFSYVHRSHDTVSELRAKGYKVTTFEKALKYLGLSGAWDCAAMERMEKEHKKATANPSPRNSVIEIKIPPSQ